MKGVKVTYRDGDICKKQAHAHSLRPRGGPLASAASRRTCAFGADAAQVNGQMEIGSREVTYQIQCDPSQARRLPPSRTARRAAAVVRRCPRVTSHAVVTWRSQDVGLLKHISEVSMCEYSIIFLSKHGCPVGTVGGCAEPHSHTHLAWLARGREPPTSPRVPLYVPLQLFAT